MKVLLWSLLLVAATPAAALTGDQILARAGNATGLHSYSVPVQFDVQMHKPVGIKSSAAGIVTFKAPAEASLTITKMPSILGKFFKSSYLIDLAPQVWPAKYTVQSVSDAQRAGVAVFALQAVPKNDPSVDHVVFEVTKDGYSPVSASWYYKDGSSVKLQITATQTSGFWLPQTVLVSVSMPQYSLDATVNYGAYALNQ